MDNKDAMKKVLIGLHAATEMLNKSMTPEIIEAMTPDQRELYEEAKEAGSLTGIKAVSDKLEKLNQKYK